MYSGKLPDCGHNCSATLRDLLEQPDDPGMDYSNGQQEATIVCDEIIKSRNLSEEELEYCSNSDDKGRTYVTGLCYGRPKFDTGRCHNHCTVCSNFGVCLGGSGLQIGTLYKMWGTLLCWYRWSHKL